MTAADEARAEAHGRWDRGDFSSQSYQQIFVAGAEWQASRDSAELTRLYAINEELAGQLQAAQATIAEAIAEGELVQEQFQQGDSLNSVIDILSRADTSAHDAAILAAKADAWDEGHEHCFHNHEPEAPPNPYRASIEQAEADRG